MAIFDRTDFRLTRGILLVIAVISPLRLLAPVVVWLSGGDLGWSGYVGPDGRSLAALVTAEHGARLTWDGRAGFALPDAPVGLWLATLTPRILEVAVVIAVALLVRRVLTDIEVGRPFTVGNLRALRTVGLTVVAAAVVLPFVDGAVSSAVAAYATAGGFSFNVAFEPAWLLGGMLVLAMVEAFRVGASLADDVEGLV